MPTRPDRALIGSLLGGAIVCVVVGTLVFRSLFVAMPQSYDALLYGRSLWGVANDVAFNPVYGTHWLGVHANLVFYALAPISRWLDPVALLAACSALSIGAIAAAAGSAAARARQAPGLLPALGFALLTGLLTPLVTNPFLFDARPEAIAVALLSVALLRARSRDEFDLLALIGLIGAALVREEFAVVGASSLILAPIGWRCRRASIVRVVVAALLIAWAALYVLWLRPQLDAGFAGDRANTAADDLFGWGDAATWRYRATLVVSFVLSGGGLAMRGFRWLGASALGVVFCLAVDKSGALAIRFHYLMLLAPGLVVAMVDGYARGARPLRREMGVAFAVSLALTWHHGALPGSREYDDAFFAVFDDTALIALADARAALAAVPDDAGMAAPYVLASDEADRVSIHSMETFVRAMREQQTLPDDIEFVALLGADFATLGRLLVQQHGLRLVNYQPGQFALLTSRPIAPGEHLAGISCAGRFLQPSLRWPELGIDVVYGADEVLLLRTATSRPVPTLLPARRDRNSVSVVPPLEGLLRLADIPPGCTASLGNQPDGDWVLVAPDGTIIEPVVLQRADGSTN